MNARSLSDKAKHLSEQLGVTPNFIVNHYFFDAIIKRISLSDYKNMFVLKGGYLLSMNLGITTRTTNDLDFLFKSKGLRDNITTVLHSILQIDAGDSITFEIQRVEPIKDGLGDRFKILCMLENIRQYVSIDVAIGDPVTPNIHLKKYSLIVDDEIVELYTYPYETVIAEKLQTVIQLGTASSRVKDLYDLHVIHKLVYISLDRMTVKEAIQATFEHRHTNNEPQYILSELHMLRESKLQETLWNNYTRKHYFAQGITFHDIFNDIISLVKNIFDM